MVKHIRDAQCPFWKFQEPLVRVTLIEGRHYLARESLERRELAGLSPGLPASLVGEPALESYLIALKLESIPESIPRPTASVVS